MKSKVFIILLLILAIAGSAALLAGTRWGIGASPDSVYYIGAARNILEGRGYSLPAVDGSDTPLTHLPPFYSALLALLGSSGLGVSQAARWLNVLLFGAGIFMVGLLTSRLAGPGESWIALVGAFLFLTSVVALEFYLMAWSEPLFIFLGLLGLILLGRYLDSPKLGWLLASAVLTGLALLTRFAGAAFVVTGAIGILFFSPGKAARRLLNTGLFGGLSSIPILLWLIRNTRVGGTATSREFVFHPIGKLQISQGLTTLASWLFIPDTARTLVKIGVLLIIALGISAAIILAMRSMQASEDRSFSGRFAKIPGIVKLLVIFILVYPVFLVFSLSFFDANTPLDQRILSPVFVTGLILICFALIEVFKRRGKYRLFKLALSLLAFLFCIFYLIDGVGLLAQAYRTGIGFNSAAWQQSATLKGIQQLPPGVDIFSNAPEGILLHTGRPALTLPRKMNLVIQRPNPDYPENLAAMLNKMEEDGDVIVYFKGLDWPSLPSEQELVETLPIRVLERYADGTIYGVPPK